MIFRVTVRLLIYFNIDLCPHWRNRWDSYFFAWESQKDKPQTHTQSDRTAREISRETGIHRSSVPRLFARTCIWNVSRGAVHRRWQTRTTLLAWSALSFCFRSSRSMPLTLFSSRTTRRPASDDRTARRQYQAICPVITGSCPTNVIVLLHGLSMDLTVGRTVGPTVDSTVGWTVGLTVKLCKHWFDIRSN